MPRRSLALAPLLAFACARSPQGATVAGPSPRGATEAPPSDDCARAAAARARAPSLLAEGRLDRALRVLAWADARCPAAAREGRGARVVALAEIGRDAEARALAASIDGEQAASVAERDAATRARGLLDARAAAGAPGTCEGLARVARAARDAGDVAEAQRRLDRAAVACAREGGAQATVESRRPRLTGARAGVIEGGGTILLPAVDEVLVLDAVTGATRLRLPARAEAEGGAPAARRSPAGRFVEVRGRDGLSRFDATTGARLQGADGGLLARDDRTLVRAGPEGVRLEPLDGAKGRTLPRRGRVLDVGVDALLLLDDRAGASADGRPSAESSAAKATTATLELLRFDGTARALAAIPARNAEATTAAISDDGAFVTIAVGGARELAVHDARTGARARAVRGAVEPTFDAATRRFCFGARDCYSASGVAASAPDAAPSRAATLALDAARARSAPAPRDLAVSADGQLFGVALGRAVATFARGASRPQLLTGLAADAVAVSLDGARVLGAGGAQLRGWTSGDALTFASRELAPDAALTATRVTPALARHPAGGFAAWDGAALLRVDPRALSIARSFALPPEGAPLGLSFDQSGERVALASAGGVRVLDRDGAQRAKVEGASPALSPDGRWLATTRGVFELPGGAPRLSRALERPAFSPGGRWLAALSPDRRSVELLDARSFTKARALALDAEVAALAFVAGDQELAVATADGRVLLWSIRTLWPGGEERPSAAIGLLDDRVAAWVSAPDGELETLGDVADVLSCRFGNLVMPFALCEERFVVRGLAARALAGERVPEEP